MIMWEVSPGHIEYVSGKTGQVWQTGPNSAGGVGVRFRYRNDGEKTIKYATFTVAPYNAVQDIQRSATGGHSAVGLKVTGPIEAGGSGEYTFANVWYNPTITTVALTKIHLQYMDGSEETVAGSDIRYEAPPSGGGAAAWFRRLWRRCRGVEDTPCRDRDW